MIIRASSLGSCLKGQIAAALGMKPIPHTDEQALVMAQGQLHEDDVVASLTAEGYTISNQQDEVNLPACVEDGLVGVVQGHLDGMIFDPNTGPIRVLEIKSMGDSTFKTFKAKGWEAGGLIDRYKWQISVYMHATGLEALVVCKNRNNGELMRHGVEMPFYSLDQIAERVGYIEEWVGRGELPTECPQDFFCNYRYLCERPANEEEQGGSPASDEFTPTGALAVEMYDFLGSQIKELETQRAAHRSVFEAELGARTKMQAGKYRVQLVTQQIKERVVPASTRQMLRVTKVEDE